MTKRKAICDIVITIIFFVLFTIVGCIAIYSVAHGKGVTLINIIAMVCTGYTVVDRLLNIWASFPDYLKVLQIL